MPTAPTLAPTSAPVREESSAHGTTDRAPRGATAPGPGRRRRFADLPLAVKIGTVLAVMASVAGGMGWLGVSATDDLATGQGRLYDESVQPTVLLVDLQRTFQGSRVRANAYAFVDPADRDALRLELDERETSLAELVGDYRPHAADPDAVDTLLAQATAFHTAVRERFVPAVDVGDTGSLADIYAQDVYPAADAVNEIMSAEAEAQAADAADQHAAGSAVAARSRTLLLGSLLAGLVVAVAVAVVVVRGILRTVGTVSTTVQALAHGDLTHEPDAVPLDEVGRMAASLAVALRGLRATMASVAHTAGTVATAAEELSSANTQVAAASEETSTQAGVVAAASEQVSRNVQAVAAGAEQMGASIREIAGRAHAATRVAADAVASSESTAATVSALGDSAKEIGDVVKVITSIAEQTNLLALNATIEAARAGEAGRGFAVVAGEVKDLAQESARAAEDIASRITTNQAQTASAVAAISGIARVVATINDHQLAIAGAVEEQTATTNEMARGVVEAASGSVEIATNITGVATSASVSSEVLGRTAGATADLARMADDLRTRVGAFRY